MSRSENVPIEPDAAEPSGEARAARAAGSRLSFPAASAIETLIALTGLGVCVVWAWRDGGFAPGEWLPGGLLLLALLCTAAASADVRARLRARPLPLGLFGLYVAWSYLSILWAQVPGDALGGANRTLVYWLVFALFWGLGLGERVGGAVVAAWGVAVAVLGLVALAQAATATRPAGHFVLGRLAAPISYPVADAALFLSACLPLVVLSSRRQTHVALRVLAGVTAVVLADLSVLCQSRGSLFALPFAVLVYLLVARDRLRALAHLAVVAAAVTAAVPAALRVYPAVVNGRDWPARTTDAAAWLALSAALAAVAFLLLTLIDRRVHLSPRVHVLFRRILWAVAACAVVAAVIGLARAHPVARAETAWRDFTTNVEAAPTTPHFAAGLGTSRYDVWRVAVDQFVAHPLTGVGTDNFVVGYLKQRRTREVSRYPSSVELRTFSETGIVGAILCLGFLGIAFWRAAIAARRSLSPGTALACLAGSAYWLLHGSVDSFWEYPALAGSALALLAIAAAPTPAELTASPEGLRRPHTVLVLSIAAASLVAAAALALPWASVSLIDSAVARGAGAHAYSELRTAARLNPLAAEPYITEATLAANAGDRVRERRALLQALRRNPHDWYPYFMLGIVAGREHKLGLARRELERAHRLSPEDLVIVYAQRRLRWGRPLTEQEVGQIFREVSSTLRGVRQR